MPSQPARRRPDPEALAWPALCALLGIGAIAAGLTADPQRLVWNAADWTTNPWTLWSASLVHLSAGHLGINLAALALIAMLGMLLHARLDAALALLLVWPLVTLALLAWPQLGAYCGMSGLLNAMLALLCVQAAAVPVRRRWALWLLAGQALKLAGEQGWSQPLAFDASWGFDVAYAAHLAGALAGAVAGLLCAAVRCGRCHRP